MGSPYSRTVTMTKNITSLSKKRKKRSPEKVAEAAARLVLDNTHKGMKEPKGLASDGDMSKTLDDDGHEKDE